jgi:hypothetical protein
MSFHCQALTVRGRKCRHNAVAYGRVEWSDGAREYLVCPRHQEAIRLGQFRPARSGLPVTTTHRPTQEITV